MEHRLAPTLVNRSAGGYPFRGIFTGFRRRFRAREPLRWNAQPSRAHR
jgi:hypothetical protein